MRHVNRWLAAILLCIAFARMAGAQVQKPVEYVLGVADVVTITVGNHDDLDQTAAINEDGRILLKGVGEMNAAGLTVAGLRKALQTELDKTLNNDPVTVTLRERHAETVKIMGAVVRPGPFDLKSGWRALDLAASAGMNLVNPRLSTAKLIRGSREFQLDLAAALNAPLTDANMLLQPNDTVIVQEIAPPERRQVAMEGPGVTRAGLVEINADTSTLALLSACGGLTQQAALSRTYVIRNDRQIPLNLRPLVALGQADDAVAHFKYQNGDEVFVPALDTKFTVMGAVGRPGVYYIPEQGGMTVFDAINLAGEITADSTAGKARIYRKTGDKITTININLDKVMKHGDLKNNIAIQPGDTIFVPPHKKSPFPSIYDVFAPLSLLTLLGFRL